MPVSEQILQHVQHCVKAWIWAWTLNGCVLYTCFGQCFLDCSLKTFLPGAEVAGSTGLFSHLSGSRPYTCCRAALLTATVRAVSQQQTPCGTSVKGAGYLAFLIGIFFFFLNLESSNSCRKIESKADLFWAQDFTTVWRRFESSRHCVLCPQFEQ